MEVLQTQERIKQLEADIVSPANSKRWRALKQSESNVTELIDKIDDLEVLFGLAL